MFNSLKIRYTKRRYTYSKLVLGKPNFEGLIGTLNSLAVITVNQFGISIRYRF